MKECRLCKEEIKDSALKCWHCNTMLRRSWLGWLVLIALVASAFYSWLLVHQDHGHLGDLTKILDNQAHISSLVGVLGSVLVAGIFRSPLGE